MIPGVPWAEFAPSLPSVRHARFVCLYGKKDVLGAAAPGPDRSRHEDYRLGLR